MDHVHLKDGDLDGALVPKEEEEEEEETGSQKRWMRVKRRLRNWKDPRLQGG